MVYHHSAWHADREAAKAALQAAQSNKTPNSKTSKKKKPNRSNSIKDMDDGSITNLTAEGVLGIPGHEGLRQRSSLVPGAGEDPKVLKRTIFTGNLNDLLNGGLQDILGATGANSGKGKNNNRNNMNSSNGNDKGVNVNGNENDNDFLNLAFGEDDDEEDEQDDETTVETFLAQDGQIIPQGKIQSNSLSSIPDTFKSGLLKSASKTTNSPPIPTHPQFRHPPVNANINSNSNSSTEMNQQKCIASL